MSGLPVEEIVHEEENPVCDRCGSSMTPIGKEKLYDELVYQPASFYVCRHYAKKYKCTKCGQDPEKDVEQPDEIEKCNIRCAPHPQPMKLCFRCYMRRTEKPQPTLVCGYTATAK